MLWERNAGSDSGDLGGSEKSDVKLSFPLRSCCFNAGISPLQGQWVTKTKMFDRLQPGALEGVICLNISSSLVGQEEEQGGTFPTRK